MSVVLTVDTNLLGNERPLTGNAVARLLDESTRRRVDVRLSALVLRELVNGWVEELIRIDGERVARTEKLRSRGAEAFVDEARRVDPAALRRDEEARVHTLLADADVEILPLAHPSHEVVLERALTRRQPFDNRGRNGYRDTLLWESVLSLAADDNHVVFASKDGDAYFQGRTLKTEPKRLASRLREEVRARCGDGDAVTLLDDLDAAIDRALELAQAQQEQADELADERRRDNELALELEARLENDEAFRAELEEELAQSAAGEELTPSLRPFGFDADVFYAEIASAEVVGRMRVLSAHQLSTGTSLVSFDVSMSVELDLAVHPSEAAMLEDQPGVHVVDFGIEKGVGHVLATVETDARFEALLSRDRIETASLTDLFPNMSRSDI